MTQVWLTIGLVALASFTLKAAGPLVLGDRQLEPLLRTVQHVAG